MFYHVQIGTPVRDMGGWGFNVQLWPAWKAAVEKAKLDQAMVNRAVGNLGRRWLDACGYDGIFDPDNCGFDADRKKPAGPNTRPMYLPNHDLHVQWGEWGPEHITVPGNACGLDIDKGIAAPHDGRVLYPHNVDCMAQAYLLMLVFSWFAGTVILENEVAGRGQFLG